MSVAKKEESKTGILFGFRSGRLFYYLGFMTVALWAEWPALGPQDAKGYINVT